MPWIVLLISSIFEAVWATALGYSQGFTQPIPTLVYVIASVLSMLGLGWATRSIPIGTAYAVWTGCGAALTVAWSILTGDEPASVGKLVCMAGIIGTVIGLKLLPSNPTKANRDDASNDAQTHSDTAA